MKNWRITLLGLLTIAIVGCNDPTAPRIPNPDDPGGDDDDSQGITVVVDR